MNWAEIRKLYLRSVGETTNASEEWPLHLTEGYRQVCSRLDLRELEATYDAITVANQDYIAISPTPAVYHVIQVINVTNGWSLAPEENGSRSRSRYLEENTGKPGTGEPMVYDLSGTRLWLRPTPDDAYTLRVRYKIQPNEITASDMGFDPIIPSHLHMAIVHGAAASYFLTHLEADKDGAAQQRAMSAMQGAISEPMLPKDRERFDQRGRFYLRSFRFSAR